MKKILVPCDFSVAAYHAYQFARELASAQNGEVCVLHVVEIQNVYGNGMAGQPYSAADTVTTISEIKRDAQNEFEKMEQAFSPISAPVHFTIQVGPLTETILKVIEHENIDLVVMATSGVYGIKEFFMGSNTEKIVRSSSVPVFAIHKLEHAKDVRNIIFPTSLDLTQHDLIAKVKALQHLFDAVIHVLFINNYPTSLIKDEEMGTAMHDYADFYQLEKYTLNIRQGGDLEAAIIRFANTVPYSIIAMSTHGYHGFNHLLKGSVAEDVVNHVDETVWTYVSPPA